VNKGILASLGLVVLFSAAASAQAPPASKAGAAGTVVPKIVKPAPGSMNSGVVTLKVDPAPGSKTKNFALDWEARVAGRWTAWDVVDSAGLGDQKIPSASFRGAGEWRVRARAIEGENAPWSEWLEFRTPASSAKKAPRAKKVAVTE